MAKESKKPLDELTAEERLSIAEGIEHPSLKKELASAPFPPSMPHEPYEQLRHRVIQLDQWRRIADQATSWPRQRVVRNYIKHQLKLAGRLMRKHHKVKALEDVELWGHLDEDTRIPLAYRAVKPVMKASGYSNYYTSSSRTHRDRLIAEGFATKEMEDPKTAERVRQILVHDMFRIALPGLPRSKGPRPRSPKEAAHFVTLANLELAWLRSYPASPDTVLAIRAMCFLKARYLDDMTHHSVIEVAYYNDWYMDEFLPPEERTLVVSRWRKYRGKLKEQKRLKKEADQRAEEKRRAEWREYVEQYGGPAGANKSRTRTPKGGSIRTVQGGAPGLGKGKS
ncbi:MAG: hypothetical protein ACQEXI_12560 [Pseudomonadota bacterium]